MQLLFASLLLEKPRELVCTSPGHSVLTAGGREETPQVRPSATEASGDPWREHG